MEFGSSMWLKYGVLVMAILASASAFQQQAWVRSDGRRASSVVHARVMDIDEHAVRDVGSFEEWARNCGVQMAEGVSLVSNLVMDYSMMTTEDIPAGSPVLYVPCEMILSSDAEYGDDYDLSGAEDLLGGVDVPLFRLFVRILMEYVNGEQSPYFPWLNALPRRYFGGASMTYACFDCLPPYVSMLCKNDRAKFTAFRKVLENDPFLEGTVLTQDRQLLKFAYNVAQTRSFDDEHAPKRIVPMADMFNHAADAEVQLTYDEAGNCFAYATRDIPAGSPLRICYGDTTNPSPLFARYGFLDQSSNGSFCKILHLQNEMTQLGMDFSDLLFFKDGSISEQVYDLVLYSLLAQDAPHQQTFYNAYLSGDTDTKTAYHTEYLPYTLQALQKHVDTMLEMLDRLSLRALGYDPTTHPRVPVILEHNFFVKNTFTLVKANIDTMAQQYEFTGTDR